MDKLLKTGVLATACGVGRLLHAPSWVFAVFAIFLLCFATFWVLAPRVLVFNSVPQMTSPSEADMQLLRAPDARQRPNPATPTQRLLLRQFAQQELPVWPKGDKGCGPAVALAKLLIHGDTETVNALTPLLNLEAFAEREEVAGRPVQFWMSMLWSCR